MRTATSPILLFALLSACTAMPDMVRVGPGTFTAGSSPVETQAALYPRKNAAREQPARMVRIAHASLLGGPR